MMSFFVGLLACFGAFFRARYNLGLESLALRQIVPASPQLKQAR
jgi:hypothetical protein